MLHKCANGINVPYLRGDVQYQSKVDPKQRRKNVKRTAASTYWGIAFANQARFRSCSMWSPPPIAHFKLSFDGSVDGNPRLAGIEGVIHDSNSLNVVSFLDSVCHCSINKVELLALRQGLQEASHMKLQPLLVEGDLECVLRWVSRRSTPPWRLLGVVDEVKDLARNLNANLSHIRRSTNEVVDILAKEGVHHQTLFVDFPS
ncbi:hypothetical protein AAC387_Pa02g1389 [Persea americana]